MLIEWVKNQGDPEIEVATKWGYTYVANFNTNATLHEVKDHGIEKLNEQWEVSKQLLPYLTTLQIHSATLETGVLKDEEVLKRLGDIKMEYNLIIGLTTTGDNQAEVMKKAFDISMNGYLLFDEVQLTYNILDQSLLDTFNKINTSGRRIIIKEALANGRIFPNAHYPQYANMYIVLAQMASKYEVGIDAIAIRFCIDSVGPFLVISGASKSQQVKENLKSNDFKLDEDDVLTLKSFKIDPRIYWKERKQLQWS
jgi:aryl-alcohol dehydrogenase-like predicted oxidoreductase